jgi:hypothetical protein
MAPDLRSIPHKMRHPPFLARHGAAALRAATTAALALLALAASSCRQNVVAPVTSLPPHLEAAAGADGPLGVPVVTHLEAQSIGDTLYIVGRLRSRDRAVTPFYDPSHLGGWSLQVMLDNDPARDIYWRGFDYIVRGVEWDRISGTFVTRRIDLDDATPGGWGPESGLSTFRLSQWGFVVAIPMRAIGGLDHGLSFCVETYTTVACESCDGGLTQDYPDDYFGTLGNRRPRFATQLASRLHSTVTPLLRHGADADPRLAGLLAFGR